MSKITDRMKRLVDGMEDRHAFKLEGAILKFTHLLWQRMSALGIGTTDLAKRIEARPPYVSKILRGKSNFTLDSIIKLCSALDSDFVFDVIPKQKQQFVSIDPVQIDMPSENSPSSYNTSINRVGSNPPMVKIPNYDRCLLA